MVTTPASTYGTRRRRDSDMGLQSFLSPQRIQTLSQPCTISLGSRPGHSLRTHNTGTDCVDASHWHGFSSALVLVPPSSREEEKVLHADQKMIFNPFAHIPFLPFEYRCNGNSELARPREGPARPLELASRQSMLQCCQAQCFRMRLHCPHAG